MAWTLTTPAGGTLTQGSTTAQQTLGDIQSEETVKNATLTVNPIIFNDSGQTDVIDFGGAVREIDIVGVITDTAANNALNATTLNGLINGNQDISAGYPLTYTSDIQGTVKVKVKTVRTSHFAGMARRLPYVISMVESSQNG